MNNYRYYTNKNVIYNTYVKKFNVYLMKLKKIIQTIC